MEGIIKKITIIKEFGVQGRKIIPVHFFFKKASSSSPASQQMMIASALLHDESKIVFQVYINRLKIWNTSFYHFQALLDTQALPPSLFFTFPPRSLITLFSFLLLPSLLYHETIFTKRVLNI